MAIQSNFPSIRPSLLLDFANSGRLDPRITFTRASTATYYDANGVALAEQNLIIQSQAVNDSAWGIKTDVTITADSTTAPDGTSTADTVTEGVVLNGLLGQASRPNIPGTAFTASVYLKKSVNNDWVRFFCNGVSSGSNSITGYFNLDTGVAGTPVNGGTGSGGALSIVNAGSGWYRCIVSGIIGTETQLNFAIASATADGNSTRIANATYFIWGAQLEQRSAVTAYTATTTATITNYIPQLKTAAANVARFDYDPVTRVARGLLIEESRANIMTQSEDFTSWSLSSATVTSNTVVAPDGAITADILTPSSSGGYVVRNYTATGDGEKCYSIFMKAGTSLQSAIVVYDVTAAVTRHNVRITWTAGVPSIATSSGTGTLFPVQSVGNGWYRISFTATGIVAANTNSFLIYPNNTSPGTGTIIAWGVQAENATFATSYIPTVASAVTRSADAASMTGTNFSSWFNNAEGTVYVESTPLALGVGTGVTINDNTTSNRIRVALNSTSDQSLITTGGTAQATLDGGTPAAGTTARFATAYKVNDFALSLNGGAVATDTSGTVPVVSQMQIGGETTTYGSARIRKVAYYPLRVTDTNLVALTG